jgi:hypothetical protein
MHRTSVAGEGPTAPDEGPAAVAPAREVDMSWGRSQLELV